MANPQVNEPFQETRNGEIQTKMLISSNPNRKVFVSVGKFNGAKYVDIGRAMFDQQAQQFKRLPGRGIWLYESEYRNIIRGAPKVEKVLATLVDGEDQGPGESQPGSSASGAAAKKPRKRQAAKKQPPKSPKQVKSKEAVEESDTTDTECKFLPGHLVLLPQKCGPPSWTASDC